MEPLETTMNQTTGHSRPTGGVFWMADTVFQASLSRGARDDPPSILRGLTTAKSGPPTEEVKGQTVHGSTRLRPQPSIYC